MVGDLHCNRHNIRTHKLTFQYSFVILHCISGQVYDGLRYEKGNCGVSIMRSGECNSLLFSNQHITQISQCKIVTAIAHILSFQLCNIMKSVLINEAQSNGIVLRILYNILQFSTCVCVCNVNCF